MRRLALVVPLMLVAAAVVGAPAVAGGGCHDGGNKQVSTTSIDMKDLCFTPSVAHVDVGDKVTWTNVDPVFHNVVGVGGSWYIEQDFSDGDRAAIRFDEPGTYVYSCAYHPGMSGAVVVGDGEPDDGVLAAPVAVSASTSGDGGGAESEPASRPAPEDESGIEPISAVALIVLAGVLGYGLARVPKGSFAALLPGKRL
jgi:plastocyanin